MENPSRETAKFICSWREGRTDGEEFVTGSLY
jgi:hypothetical protein